MIQDLRDEVVKKAKSGGCICPVCDQTVKVYKRKLTSSMAIALIEIYKYNKKEYMHVESLLKKLDLPASIRGDFPKLRFWGLIKPQRWDREDGSNRNGYYKITDRGIYFVEGKSNEPSHVSIFNNKLVGLSGSYVKINDCLINNKFNYKEI